MGSSTGPGVRRAAALVKVSIGIIVLIAVVFGGYAVFESEAGVGAKTTLTSDLVAAEVMSFDVSTKATGELQAASQIEVRSQLESEATIVEVAEEGSRVAKGDLLVRLSSDDIKTEVEEEELRVESARAEVVAAENAYLIQVSRNDSALRDARLQLELAELALEQWLEGDDKKMRVNLRLRIEETERELDRLKKELEKSRELHAEGFLSDNKLEQDEIAVIKAEADFETAQLESEIYEGYTRKKEEKQKRSDVIQAQANLEEVKAQNEIELASKEADRTNQRRQLQQREARLNRHQRELAATEILAPTDGLVVHATSLDRGRRGDDEGPLQIGRRVWPNMLLIVLPDVSEMLATVRVHESLVGRIQTGQRASVKIDAVGGEVFTGTVSSIGVLAETGGWRDPNRREYTVQIKLDASGRDENLKPSMACEATIFMDRVEEALAVPLPAVFNEGGVRFVYVEQGSQFVKRPVKVGRRSDTYAEVVAGLSSGERVLVREPEASEVIQRDWDKAELETAGLSLDDNGNVISGERMRGGQERRAGRSEGSAPTRGQRSGDAETRVAEQDDGERQSGSGQGASGSDQTGAQ
jgi:RND family efflux transporter MFP subunit